MTDLTLPAEGNGEIDNLAAAHSWEQAGTGAWIVDGSDIGGAFPSLTESGLQGFDYDSASGLTVTILGGEAFGIGGWLARDRTTDVDVTDDATTTIYVGIDIGAVLASGTAPADNDNIIIGPASAFEAPDPRAPIWEVTASGGSVTSTTDLRHLRKPVRWDPVGEQVRLDGASIDGEATVNYSPDGAGTIAPLAFDPDDGGTVYVSGLVNNPDIGADRAVAFSNGNTPNPPPAWFDVQNGEGYAEDGDRIATHPWANSNFNDYTFSESYTDLTDVPSEFAPETHGNGAHSTTYASESLVEDRTKNSKVYRIQNGGAEKYDRIARVPSDDFKGKVEIDFADPFGGSSTASMVAYIYTQNGSVTLETETFGDSDFRAYPVATSPGDVYIYIYSSSYVDARVTLSWAERRDPVSTDLVADFDVTESSIVADYGDDPGWITKDVGDLYSHGDATLRKTEAWDEGTQDRVVFTDTDGGELELVRE